VDRERVQELAKIGPVCLVALQLESEKLCCSLAKTVLASLFSVRSEASNARSWQPSISTVDAG
jgi:hypothetical protein